MQSKNKNDGVKVSNRYLAYMLAKGRLAGWGGREVFSFGEGGEFFDVKGGERETISGTVRPGMSGLPGSGETYISSINQLNNPTHANNRVYGDNGLSPSLNTMQGGNRQPKIVSQLNPSLESGGQQPFQQNGIYDSDGLSPALQSQLPEGGHKIIIQKSADYREDGSLREFGNYAPTLRSNMGDNHPMVLDVRPVQLGQGKDSRAAQGETQTGDTDEAFTLRSCNPNGVLQNTRIRRLTPVECERLQAYPDGYTETGIDESGNEVKISDSQRYKVLGNSVTTSVITAIMEQIYGNE